MHYLDPDGPIDQLREELISLTMAIVAKMPTTDPDRLLFLGDIIPRIRKDDHYARAQARRLIQVARKVGVPYQIKKH